MRRYYTGIMRGRVRYSSRWGLGARMSVGGGGVRGGVVTWSKATVTSSTDTVSSTTQRTCSQGTDTRVH